MRGASGCVAARSCRTTTRFCAEGMAACAPQPVRLQALDWQQVESHQATSHVFECGVWLGRLSSCLATLRSAARIGSPSDWCSTAPGKGSSPCQSRQDHAASAAWSSTCSLHEKISAMQVPHPHTRAVYDQ